MQGFVYDLIIKQLPRELWDEIYEYYRLVDPKSIVQSTLKIPIPIGNRKVVHWTTDTHWWTIISFRYLVAGRDYIASFQDRTSIYINHVYKPKSKQIILVDGPVTYCSHMYMKPVIDGKCLTEGSQYITGTVWEPAQPLLFQ
jgi:hypothetical protein